MLTELKKYFILNKIKQIEVVDYIGMNYSQFNRYINGYDVMPEKYHQKFCDFLKIDLTEFKKGKVKKRKN